MTKEKRKLQARRLRKNRLIHRSILTEKWREAYTSVLPITLIVLFLCFLCVPAPVSAMLGFLLGAVMLLGFIFKPDGAAYSSTVIPNAADTLELSVMFARSFPHYMKEVAVALLPIAAFFALFQIFVLHLKKREVLRIVAGLLYTYAGLALFLTGVNVGFMPMGNFLGHALGGLSVRWLLVPLGMLIGYYVVSAEPAVHVLSKQVYELTAGAIPQKALGLSLSIGVSVSVGLSMLRILTGINILWLLVPGYAIALILMFFVPPIFTSIAFDSGGVASGPMTATFLLPLAMGACTAVGGDVATDGTNPDGENRFFGLSIADEKEMLLILTAANQKSTLMRAIMENAGVQNPAHTIMFSLPVESVAGLRSVMAAAGEIED